MQCMIQKWKVATVVPDVCALWRFRDCIIELQARIGSGYLQHYLPELLPRVESLEGGDTLLQWIHPVHDRP